MKVPHLLITLALAGAGCAAADRDVSEKPQSLSGEPAESAPSVSLVAVGAVDGALRDRSEVTAGALESGVPGNLLGGLGSALAYAGDDTFLALPDRGPNANVYNPAIDNTTSYVNRVQTLRLRLRPSPDGAPLPLSVEPAHLATTLLFSREPLAYGSGASLGLGSGAPALNDPHHFYFVGRADNYDPEGPRDRDARLDPEGLRLSNDGERIYVSDEYGPYVYEFERESGQRLRTLRLPDGYVASALRLTELEEIAANRAGRLTNKGMEGLAITPDGKTLVGIMQSPLLQDGGASARFVRLVQIDLHDGSTSEYAYELSDIGTPEQPKFAAVSEILAVSEHEFLIDERDSTGLGAGSAAAFKRIFHVDLRGAEEISGVFGEANLRPRAAKKALFLDLVAALGQHGIAPTELPSKIEGLTFGPDVEVDGQARHTLWVSSDNDFLARLTDEHHPGGIDNPSRFFVFAFDDAALPGYVPQRLSPRSPPWR